MKPARSMAPTELLRLMTSPPSAFAGGAMCPWVGCRAFDSKDRDVFSVHAASGTKVPFNLAASVVSLLWNRGAGSKRTTSSCKEPRLDSVLMHPGCAFARSCLTSSHENAPVLLPTSMITTRPVCSLFDAAQRSHTALLKLRRKRLSFTCPGGSHEALVRAGPSASSQNALRIFTHEEGAPITCTDRFLQYCIRILE